MNKTILFSPVGGTDPISYNNFYDGSLIHICRTKLPDKVILFMSQEMLECEEKDQRFTKALKLLEKKVNKTFIVEQIKRPNLENVHEFDYFYKDFNETIKGIQEKMDDSDTLLVNVSSGTPAMKSTLNVLSVLGEIKATCIQVAAPNKKIGEHNHPKDYELETLWELNPDNSKETFEDRTAIVKCPNLVVIKQEQNLKELIENFDYDAALKVASTSLPEWKTRNYIELLQMAKYRSLLNLKKADAIANRIGYDYSPEKSSKFRNIFEYALSLDIKRKKGEFADFIRALTPLIADIFELLVEKLTGVTIESITEISKKKNREIRIWSKNILTKSTDPKIMEIDDILVHKFDYEFDYSTISSAHLEKIIAEKAPASIADLAHKLRVQVEENVRNQPAHEIVMVDEEYIKKMSKGLDSVHIMQIIKKLLSFTEITVKENDSGWNSYEEMNSFIISQIK